MGDPRGFDHPRAFQFNMLSADMLEQADTFTEQYGHEVNLYFIRQSERAHERWSVGSVLPTISHVLSR